MIFPVETIYVGDTRVKGQRAWQRQRAAHSKSFRVEVFKQPKSITEAAMCQRRSISAFPFLSLVLFLLFALQGTAFGQRQLNTCKDIETNKDFFSLGTAGGELNFEIRRLEKDLDTLQSQIPKAIPDQKLKQYRQQLEVLQNKTTKTPEEGRQYQTLMSQTQDAISLESLNEQLTNTKKGLEDKRGLIQCIQQRLSSIYTPEQSFKLTMSVSFAALIGLVILGFFTLSFKDEAMRRAIFSGQAGMQFLTLFSIVIAIILFGITSTLVDKELAALLGGLSGYILGRTGASRDEKIAEPSFSEKLASISIEPPAISLTSTSPTQQLMAIPKDKNGNVIKDDGNVFKLSWKSSDPSVATVSQSGLVTHVAPGTSNITASFNNLTSNPSVVTCTQ